jgi:hypothetical protein
MSLFKSNEEKEREQRYKEVEKRIVVFPGSIAEYETSKDYTVEIIDTLKRNKGILLNSKDKQIETGGNTEFRDYLIDQGIEAIVNATTVVDPGVDAVINAFYNYGLPVRKKLPDGKSEGFK